MRILVLHPFFELIGRVLLHEVLGLALEGGSESVVEGAFDAVDWVLIESDGVKIGMEVHICSVGGEDVDEIA